MIALIAACSKNRVIGRDGKLPWNIPGELKQFKELTTGHIVVMGRRTYEATGHPLPGRMNVVVTSTQTYAGESLMSVHTLQEALNYAGSQDVYIAGGQRLYEEALMLADRIYLTVVDLTIEDGDVYFPEFDEQEFDCIRLETGGQAITYTRYLYTRKQN